MVQVCSATAVVSVSCEYLEARSLSPTLISGIILRKRKTINMLTNRTISHKAITRCGTGSLSRWEENIRSRHLKSRKWAYDCRFHTLTRPHRDSCMWWIWQSELSVEDKRTTQCVSSYCMYATNFFNRIKLQKKKNDITSRRTVRNPSKMLFL